MSKAPTSLTHRIALLPYISRGSFLAYGVIAAIAVCRLVTVP